MSKYLNTLGNRAKIAFKNKIDSKLKNNLSDPIFKILKGNKFLNNYATFLSN